MLLVLTANVCITPATGAEPIPGLSALSDTVVRESAIAFVNTTTSPGLEGATLTVDDGNRQSEQWRSSLGFSAEFTLKKPIYNGYWGMALIGGSLSDKVDVTGDAGQPVHLDFTRDVLALRGSFGLSFPMTRHFKLRPYLSLSVSDLQTQGTYEGLLTTTPTGSTLSGGSFSSKAQMLSTSGTLDALYSRWYGVNRLELSAHYTLIHTDAFSEDNPVLETEAWNDVLQLKSRFSGPTNLSTSGRFWRWLLYADYANFLSQKNISLGYTSLFEFGAGMEWQMNIKPLDWFGWQMIGLKAGVITSEHVDGYFIGITAR
jgi:hypothetical protein